MNDMDWDGLDWIGLADGNLMHGGGKYDGDGNTSYFY